MGFELGHARGRVIVDQICFLGQVNNGNVNKVLKGWYAAF